MILPEEKLSGETLENAIHEVLQRPIKQGGALSQHALAANCRHLLREICSVATAHFEQRMIEKTRNNQIDWSGLSPVEFQLYAEIAEDCWF